MQKKINNNNVSDELKGYVDQYKMCRKEAKWNKRCIKLPLKKKEKIEKL